MNEYLGALIAMFGRKDRRMPLSAEDENERSNELHYRDLKKQVDDELKMLNLRNRTTYSLKEAVMNGYSFDSLCKKQLDELFCGVKG